jgi:hypothetical protein
MREISQIESMVASLASVSASAMLAGLARGADAADRERLKAWVQHYAQLAQEQASRADAAEAALIEARAKLRFAEMQVHLLQEELDDRDMQASDPTYAILAQVRDRAD